MTSGLPTTLSSGGRAIRVDLDTGSALQEQGEDPRSAKT